MKPQVTAKTQSKPKVSPVEAIRAIMSKDGDAAEAIERYLKQRGVTIDTLDKQSEGFRRDCCGAIRTAYLSGDWSSLAHVERFDPMKAIPATKPAEPAKPVVPAQPVREAEPVQPASKPAKPPEQPVNRLSGGDPANDLAEAIRRIAGSVENRPGGIDENRFKEMFRHEIGNGVEWDKTGVAKLIEDRVEKIVRRVLRELLGKLDL